MRHLVAIALLATQTAAADTPPSPGGNTVQRTDSAPQSTTQNPYSEYGELAKLDAAAAELDRKRTALVKTLETDRNKVAAERDTHLKDGSGGVLADRTTYEWLGAVKNDITRVTFTNAEGQTFEMDDELQKRRGHFIQEATAKLEFLLPADCKPTSTAWPVVTIVYTVENDRVTAKQVKEMDPVSADVNEARTCLEQAITSYNWDGLQLRRGETATVASRFLLGP